MEGRHPQLALIFAIPNGGKRHIGTARKLKAEGVRSGVPDIFLACPRMPYDFHDLIVGYREGPFCLPSKPHFDMVIDDKAKRIEEI